MRMRHMTLQRAVGMPRAGTPVGSGGEAPLPNCTHTLYSSDTSSMSMCWCIRYLLIKASE